MQVRRRVREIQEQAQAVQPQQLLSLWHFQPPAANITLYLATETPVKGQNAFLLYRLITIRTAILS